MNPVTVLIGVAMIGYGAFTGWARKRRPGQLGKLEPMKRMWGERAGTILHLTFYTLVPVTVGVVCVVRGIRGEALF